MLSTTVFTEQAVVAITVWPCNQNVFGSNLGQITDYPD
jgi:hypothetical protein